MSRAADTQPNQSDGPADLLLVCPHLGEGGVQRVVSILANAWSRQGRKVCVATLYEMEVAYQLEPGVVFIPATRYFWVKWIEKLRMLLPVPAGWKSSQLLHFLTRLAYPLIPFLYVPLHIRVLALRSIMKKTGAPVVIGLCGSTNIITALAASPLACRCIIFERNDPVLQELDFPWNPLRPRYYNRADVVTANTRAALESMSAYVEPQKLEFVPNPVLEPDETADSSADGLFSGPTLLIVGRLHEQKAHDVLLDAFAQLDARFSDWKLSIVGQGELEQRLRAQAGTLGIAGRVVWHGHVQDPFPYYRQAQIFVLPSRHEGTPNALLEAMQSGIAAIISDASPGPLELIEDGKSGLVVPADDPLKLRLAIEKLAADPALRASLAEAARANVAGYSLPRALLAWERLIGWIEPWGQSQVPERTLGSESSARVKKPNEEVFGDSDPNFTLALDSDPTLTQIFSGSRTEPGGGRGV